MSNRRHGTFGFCFLVNIVTIFYLISGHSSLSEAFNLGISAAVNVNNCTGARTCSECIALSSHCEWCSMEHFSGRFRCNNQFSQTVCPPMFIQNPNSGHSVQILQNRPFSDSLDDTVQLRPQQIQIDSRADSHSTATIYFKQAIDYPMDLYYLMDISCTMLKHKTSVSKVGHKLATKIKATTKDFRIGFGSYVDKETIPFSNYKFDNKTTCSKDAMVDTYSFYNHLRLTSDIAVFKQKVSSARISGNLDSPEGTLDALMQVMVCQDEIGWRKQSDKIIVVATDEDFHYAGDGKIGGVIIPNDAKCRLKDGFYVGSTIYDYPSMHHIAEIAQRNKFNLVFTVNKKVVPDYQTLSNIIGPNSRVASLKVDDDTIADLIDQVYRNISSSIELAVETKPDHIEVEIWTNCGLYDRPYVQRSICQVSGHIDIIPFQLKVWLKSCQYSGSRENNLIRIGLLNKNETVEINLRELCHCECEVDGAEKNSGKCSQNGTFSCGICTTCNGIRSGKQCECDPEKPIDPKRPDAQCKQSGDTRSCSGHGQCVCAKCLCDPMFAGEFCELDESACYQNGIRCNNQGDCRNQTCVCNSDFSGKFCQCPVSNCTCIPQYNDNEICSGRGECRCGRCECRTASAYGRFCEICPLCDAPMYCSQILSCLPKFSKKFCPDSIVNGNRSTLVKQELHNKKLLQDNNSLGITAKEQNQTKLYEHCKPELCTPEAQFDESNFEIVKTFEKIDEDSINDQEEGASRMTPSIGASIGNIDLSTNTNNVFYYHCQQVINGCDVSFGFHLTRPDVESTPILDLNSPPPNHFKVLDFVETCVEPVSLVMVGSSAFGSVLIIGLITIVAAKLLTDYYDKREYSRFMTEVDHANFSQTENPLYKEVTATFRNPVFGLRDRTSKFFFPNKSSNN